MLYLTTRDPFDTFTATKAWSADKADNGGLYLPFRMPKAELIDVKARSFGQNVAEMLNAFFASRMTGREVEFSLGRSPVRFAKLSGRVFSAEFWRGPEGSYRAMELKLAQRITGLAEPAMTSWLKIAIRIAFLFGIFGELMKAEAVDAEHPVDVALPGGDFGMVMAAWYTRSMGLPIANIVCSGEQGSVVLDLLRFGQTRLTCSSAEVQELERLVYATLGIQAARTFADTVARGSTFSLLPGELQTLRHGLFCTTVSTDRQLQTANQHYHTYGYILDLKTADAYNGIMDFRTKSGELRYGLILADSSPADSADVITPALGIAKDQLSELLK